jgi:Acetyltransferase (GNAT) domain
LVAPESDKEISRSARHALYEDGIPPELELKLAGLYQNPFCSVDYFRLHKSFENLNALVLFGDGSEPTQILVYTVSGGAATVCNEYFAVREEELEYFASLIFNRYPQVNEISLSRVNCQIGKPRFPHRIWSGGNDVVIDLPRTVDEYDARLGKNTKKNVKYYLNRLRREHQDFSFEVAPADEITPALVGRIIEMNRLRMQSKHIRSGYDTALEKKIRALCSSFGLVTSITVNDVVVAGVICYSTGTHCFGEALAHDPRFNKSRIGQVCFYLTLQHLIEKGTSFYHMLEGENDYKYRFLGSNRPLCSLSLYRSRRHKILTLPQLLLFQAGIMKKKLRYWTNKYLINKLR